MGMRMVLTDNGLSNFTKHKCVWARVTMPFSDLDFMISFLYGDYNLSVFVFNKHQTLVFG